MIRNIKKVMSHISLITLSLLLIMSGSTQAQNTVDLSTHVSSTPPAGAVVQWHSATPASAANLLTPAQVSAAPAGSYYAVYYDATNNCYSPASQVVVTTNVCPYSTVDLGAHVGVAPAGSSEVWYTNSAHSGSPYATPANAGAGTYYAFFYDAVNNCYSPASAPVIVTIGTCGNIQVHNICPSNTVDLTTRVSTIPPAGTSIVWYTNVAHTGSAYATPTSAGAGIYYAFYFDAANNCYSPASNGVEVVITLCSNPDMNVSQINTPTSGNVSTNDNVPVGTTYGTPTPAPGNPAGGTITMNPNGTYTFTATTPGEYTYSVPVCPPGVTINCPTELLTVTVLDPLATNNLPIVNTDLASTTTTTPVVINGLANDAAGNAGGSLNPASVTVTTAPSNGTATVNPATGAITYTANPGFVGTDTITYQVCDNSTPTPLCASAQQIVTVLPANATNDAPTAADDFTATTGTTPASGNVLSNDTDPDGNTLTATPQVTNIPGVGTLVLNANGTYTFTAAPGFSGPVDLPYTVCDNGSPSLCSDATIHILVNPETIITNPDVAVTNINTPTTGNVNTNDNVPVGTTYGTPTPAPGNPAGATITMNPNGTYTFTATTPGEYTYSVPVCPPGVTLNCPTELLTITVLDPSATNNLPIVNTDLASTTTTTPVVINSLANDVAGNAGGSLNPASVTVTTAPSNGTATVNPATGAVTYTANPGFVGTDTITYQVCDNSTPTPLCASAQQIVTVLPANATNDAPTPADDFTATTGTTPASGNALSNDTDPDGNTLTATPQVTNIPGVGTLVLNSNGTYTFTAVPGFSGPVDLPYTVCDNGSPSLCSDATIHILVNALPETNPDFNATFVNTPVSGNVNTNDIVPGGTTYGTPFASVTNPAGGTLTMNPDGSYTFNSTNPGVYTYLVPVCPPGQSAGCPTELLTITVTTPNSGSNPPTANTDLGTTIAQTPITLNTLSNDACNNLPTCGLDPSSVTITDAPSNGVATVNPLTGAITYQANPGFSGTDTLTYQVCDTSTNPDVCATAYQIFTVVPAGGGNRIGLNDDYALVPYNVTATGNVLANDTDPENNTLIVTPQTITVPEGTFTLLANGEYTFDPIPGFSGTVDFVYQACDNGTPSVCAFASLYVTVSTQFALPAVWNQFEVIASNCNAVLNWSTLQEQNVSHYNVLRKGNVSNTFTKVARVNAAGNSDTKQTYTYSDMNLPSSTYQYTIQSVDIDGKVMYSEVRSLNMSCDDLAEVNVWPNPTTDQVYISIYNSQDTDYDVKLIDMYGKLISKQHVTTKSIPTTISFDTKALSSGIYQVVVSSPYTTRVTKVYKN